MPVSRGFNASNVVEIVTRLVLLFLHSGEGKKCFHYCAKIILGNCWRLLGDTEQIPRERQFSSFQSSDCQAGDGRAQVAAADLPATAAAMIITSWQVRVVRGRRRLKCRQSISAKLQGRSPYGAHQDRRRGKKACARPRDTTSPGKTARSALSQIRRGPYELRSICARSSAIEPNLTVPSGSLASIEPSV